MFEESLSSMRISSAQKDNVVAEDGRPVRIVKLLQVRHQPLDRENQLFVCGLP